MYEEIGGPALWADIPEPDCPPDGAIISVAATGVCRSDWHAWRGHDPVELPHVPGHEFAGTVVAVGPDVTHYQVGDRVTAPFVNGCGECDFCRTGQAQVCPNQTQPGFTHYGSFAERVVVRQADMNLVILPDELDFVTAASLGCRFATAFHAVTAQGGLKPGEWLAVFGTGGVGLSVIMVAEALGANVVAVDRSEQALARAHDLGAEHTVLSDDPAAAIVELTGGGAHVTVDAVGSAGTAEAAVRSLRRQGRHVQVGLMLGPNAMAPLPWDITIARELRVSGSHGMAACDYPAMLNLIVAGRLNPTKLVGAVIPFSELGEALMAMDQPVLGHGGMTVASVDA
jgi:alcohol dehydrogenase